jgi:hypothetical protein
MNEPNSASHVNRLDAHKISVGPCAKSKQRKTVMDIMVGNKLEVPKTPSKKRATELLDEEEHKQVLKFFENSRRKRLIDKQVNGNVQETDADTQRGENKDPGEAFFQRSSRMMFTKKLTLSKILDDRIFDCMNNNREVALVYSKDFFNKFENIGFVITKEER